MKKSKLLLALSSFNSDELRQFKRFVHSKLFNQHESTIRLYAYIRKQLSVPKPALSKEKAFNYIHPGKPYDDAVMRTCMTYLFRLVEQFLAFNELYSEKNTESRALCRAYRKRNIPKLFNQAISKAPAILQKSDKRDVDFHYQNYQLAQEKYYATTQQQRATATNLQVVSDQLDISYFANRLRQSCIMLSHKNVYNEDYDLGMINQVLAEVERQQLLHIPAISIYYYAYRAQTNTEEMSHFKTLQSLLVQNTSLFDKMELREIYLLAINIGIKYLNQNKIEVIPEVLELYKSGVSEQILLINGELSRFTHKNMIVLGVRLEQFEWIEEFLNKSKSLLNPKYRKESYDFGMARLHYAKKEYDQALNLLALSTASDDVYVNLDAKLLLTRIYYELKEFDSLEALLNSFRTFIRRKNMLGYQKLNYQNYISSLTKLMMLNPFDKSAKEKLLAELKQLQPLPNKYWFVEQLGGA